jgi:hypothetical protein
MIRSLTLLLSLVCASIAGSYVDTSSIAPIGTDSHTVQRTWGNAQAFEDIVFPGPVSPDDLTGVMIEVEIETAFLIQWMWKGHATMRGEVAIDVRHFPSWDRPDSLYFITEASGSWDQTGSNGDDGWWVGDPIDQSDFVTVEDVYAYSRHIQRGGSANPAIPESADSLAKWRSDRVTLPVRMRYQSYATGMSSFWQGKGTATATITLTYLYD